MLKEETIQISPLFISMTRPPITMGVPMEFFGINFIIFGIGMIIFTSLLAKFIFFFCISLPLHGIAYIATERDSHWMRVWITKLRQCPPTRNKSYWKSNSYQP